MVVTVKLSAEYEFNPEEMGLQGDYEFLRDMCVEWALQALAEDIDSVTVEVEVD